MVQKDLDIQEYTDPDNDPMIPHTLVLKPGLVVHSVYNGYWFWGRPSTDDLWQDLRAATRRSVLIGTSAPQVCGRRGTQATCRSSTGGSGGRRRRSDWHAGPASTAKRLHLCEVLPLSTGAATHTG